MPIALALGPASRLDPAEIRYLRLAVQTKMQGHADGLAPESYFDIKGLRFNHLVIPTELSRSKSRRARLHRRDGTNGRGKRRTDRQIGRFKMASELRSVQISMRQGQSSHIAFGRPANLKIREGQVAQLVNQRTKCRAWSATLILTYAPEPLDCPSARAIITTGNESMITILPASTPLQLTDRSLTASTDVGVRLVPDALCATPSFAMTLSDIQVAEATVACAETSEARTAAAAMLDRAVLVPNRDASHAICESAPMHTAPCSFSQKLSSVT